MREGQIGVKATVQHIWWLLFGGALTFLAFPYRTFEGSEIWPLAFVGLIPLMHCLRGASPRRAFLYGALHGFVTNFGGFWWLSGLFMEFGHMDPWIAWSLTAVNGLYQGLQFGLFGWLAAVATRRGDALPGPFLLAALFTACECLYPMVFPWYLGNSQHPFRTFVQIADVAGVYGVTFVVVAVNAALYEMGRAVRGEGGRKRQAWVALGIFVVSNLYGLWRVTEVDHAIAEAPKVSIGMVEADIGIWEKEAKGLSPKVRQRTLHRNLLRHQSLTRELVQQGAELILWPESSYIPLGDVYGKRHNVFAVGVGDGGRLALYRDLGESGYHWALGPDIRQHSPKLRAVSASREDTVVAVGDACSAIHFDGQRARPIPVECVGGRGQAASLLDVAVGAPKGQRPERDGHRSLVVAVGEYGGLYRGGLDGLEPLPTGVSSHLRGVAILDSKRAIAVGDNGVVLALDGQQVARLPSLSVSRLNDVAYHGRTRNAYVVGTDGSIFRSDRAGWVLEHSADGLDLLAVLSAPSGIYAAGTQGHILSRTPSGTWERLKLDTDAAVVGLARDGRGGLIATDSRGGAWHRARVGEPWRRMETPGIGRLEGVVVADYVRMSPIPRDVKYLYQSDTPGPTEEAFLSDPQREFGRPLRERNAIQRGFSTPLMFGAITWEHADPSEDPTGRPRRIYNTAVLLDAQGRVLGMYDKYQRLAFGEYIPFGDVFPVFYKWLPQATHFTAGADVGAIDWKGHRIGVMICYEDILVSFAHRLAGLQPNVLINITNDAWFGKTSEPYLHLNLSVMRSIETHRSLLRSTNTGVSVVIDPVGRITASTGMEEMETILEEVPMMTSSTVYERVGGIVAYLVVIWSLAAVVLRRRRRSEGRAS